MRVTVACSGGTDSVALLRVLLERKDELGLVLSVAHMHHGIRGVEADGDASFVEQLAAEFRLPFYLKRVDTPAAAKADKQGIEEAARTLRYAWFWELMAEGHADAVVTAHTLDDQAETVLYRLLRGAWTEGLSGIFPELNPESKSSDKRAKTAILRPFLNAKRSEIEEYLRTIRQHSRLDSTNRDIAFTRNRLRHDLLPALADYNPQIKTQLAHLATLARDEENYWNAELTKILPSLLLPGKPVRGGGRGTDTLHSANSISIEIERLRTLPPAVRRRVLRAAAARLGSRLDFEETERLLALCGFADNTPKMNTKLQMANGFRAERSARELRLFRAEPEIPGIDVEYVLPIPGVVDATAFGLRVEMKTPQPTATPLAPATLRASRPGDRVKPRHSGSQMKIKEALQRARLPLASSLPVVEWQGEIVWMPGVSLDTAAGRPLFVCSASPLTDPTD